MMREILTGLAGAWCVGFVTIVAMSIKKRNRRKRIRLTEHLSRAKEREEFPFC